LISIEIYAFLENLSSGNFKNNFQGIIIEGGTGKSKKYLDLPSYDEYPAISASVFRTVMPFVMGRRNFAMTRDRILTEKVIRGCWHEWPEKLTPPFQSRSHLCKKCGGFKGMVGYIDFYIWKGFGELWEQLRQRKYWGAFWQWFTQRYSWQEWESKNPSQRADVVLEFWKKKGELLDKRQA
jgi:hypothetical protein